MFAKSVKALFVKVSRIFISDFQGFAIFILLHNVK